MEKQEFKFIPIDQIKESKFNPRTHYNEKKMAELIESIKEKGVLTPLIARPIDGTFEIAAGSRRLRAAKEVGLKELPVIVRPMDDKELLEIITIENLQREDLHCLEEAEGYLRLQGLGYDIPGIAKKIGKSESYVYQRIKLLELLPEAKKALWDEKITAGHAILIARLQPKDQKKALKECLEGEFGDGPMSVRELGHYIEEQIHLDLNSASFSKKDPDLLPGEAVACLVCTKRTGYFPQLFPDIAKKNTCTDRDCFNKKVQAFIGKWLKEKSQDSDIKPLRLSGNSNYRMTNLPQKETEPIPANLYSVITDRKKESCEHAREGIITEGYHQGQVLMVCIEPNCKIHRGRSSSGGGGSGTSQDELRYREERKKEAEKEKLNLKIHEKIFAAIIAAVPKTLASDELKFIAGVMLDRLWNDYQKKLIAWHNLEPFKLQYGKDYTGPLKKYCKNLEGLEINRFLIELMLAPEIFSPHESWDKDGPAMMLVKRYKIDIEAIEKEVRTGLKAKKAKTPKKASVPKKSKAVQKSKVKTSAKKKK
jgi:ParB family chromosome partitioning protein